MSLRLSTTEAVSFTSLTLFIFLSLSQVRLTVKQNPFTIHPFPTIMSIFAYQARLAARPAGGQKKKSRHHDSPSPKHMEEPISQTFHPPVLARAHAHQFIHSQGCDSSTIAPRAGAEPPASNNNFVGQGAYRARIFERYGVS